MNQLTKPWESRFLTGLGIDSIRSWKKNSEHLFAQKEGRGKWYSAYRVRICKVERDYGF